MQTKKEKPKHKTIIKEEYQNTHTLPQETEITPHTLGGKKKAKGQKNINKHTVTFERARPLSRTHMHSRSFLYDICNAAAHVCVRALCAFHVKHVRVGNGDRRKKHPSIERDHACRPRGAVAAK